MQAQGSISKLRVLIVDDETSVADSLALVFSTQGYDSRVAYSAEQAAVIISQWQPGLVILDVMLPGMNGIDFALQLKGSYPTCRVLLFSGQENTASLVQEAIEKGHALTILAKPVDPKFFLQEAARMAAADLPPTTSEDTNPG